MRRCLAVILPSAVFSASDSPKWFCYVLNRFVGWCGDDIFILRVVIVCFPFCVVFLFSVILSAYRKKPNEQVSTDNTANSVHGSLVCLRHLLAQLPDGFSLRSSDSSSGKRERDRERGKREIQPCFTFRISSTLAQDNALLDQSPARKRRLSVLQHSRAVSYTHLTLPTIYSV